MGVVPQDNQFQKAHTIVDASVQYSSASGNWSLNFWAKNAFDEVYMQGAARQDIIVGVPRKLGVTLRVTF
jgi:outer membrane receptor protein involved in Fe transport